TGVWIPDKDIVWRAGIVVGPIKDNKLRVFLDNGSVSTLATVDVKKPEDLPPLRNPDILIGADDLTSLSYLHEPAVLYNLQYRFLNTTIYTYCGIVLVAINPYESLPIYGEDFIMQYRGQTMGELDPHIFAVAEDAFSAMTRDNENQSVIISGESGAGKTVSARFTMRYLAAVGGSSSETQVERKVLASNPIMESFGNAKTTRNDNSSRFGKFIEINFDKNQGITGANMRTYLLEKSRVVYQAEQERNYHIFYQLCESRQLPYLEELSLENAMDFYYTQQGGNPVVDTIDDKDSLQSTIDAFEILGVTSEHQRVIFRSVAAVLHLGNVKFVTLDDEPDECFIMDDDPSLANVVELLGINFPQLQKWLCNRKISTMHEIITKPLTPKQAATARDGLAKLIYSKLFDWIVQTVNEVLAATVKANSFIGVLDIYGFEFFEWNSFEQFCINFANEKLQQQFCMHVFKLEQEEYIKEEIEWTFIDFYDNQPCIDLVEGKMGIIALLDEECKVQGTDKNWIQKLYNNFGNKKHDYFSKPRTSQSSFIVHHFCGNVTYECYGFIEKNKDVIFEEYLSILRASEFEIVAEMFHEATEERSRGSTSSGSRIRSSSAGRLRLGNEKKRLKTVGSQFIGSVGQLMTTLNNTKPHYVRTIKPNERKAPFTFEPTLSVQQLRACGIIETIKISAAGFPSRWTYMDFYTRYRVLAKLSSDIDRNDLKGTCSNIVKSYISDADKIQLGKTKIFFRPGQVAYLEKLRSDKLNRTSIMIQKFIKGWRQRRRYQQLRNSTIKIQSLYRGLCARRLLLFLCQTKASTVIQKRFRGFRARKAYKLLRQVIIQMQCLTRIKFARKKYVHLLRNKKAIIIQRNVRCWMEKARYYRTLKAIILLQCCLRRLIAKRQLKKLKIEARSVAHLQELQKGMENKIISLQRRLTEQVSRITLLTMFICFHNNEYTRETDDLKKQLTSFSEVKSSLAAALKRIDVLEAEIESAKSELENSNKRYDDVLTAAEETELIMQKLSLVESQLKEQQEIETENSKLKEELHLTVVQRDEHKTELEQTREHYQRHLKDHARLEQRFDNLQEEMELQQKQQRAMNEKFAGVVSGIDLDVDGLGNVLSAMKIKYEMVKNERDKLEQELKNLAEIRGKTRTRLLKNEVERLSQMERQYWELVTVNSLLRHHAVTVVGKSEKEIAKDLDKALVENEKLKKQLATAKTGHNDQDTAKENIKDYKYKIDDPLLEYDGDLNALIGANKYLRAAVRDLEQKSENQRNNNEIVVENEQVKEVVAENEELRLRCSSMEANIESLKSQIRREFRKMGNSDEVSKKRASSLFASGRQPRITGPNAGLVMRSVSIDKPPVADDVNGNVNINDSNKNEDKNESKDVTRTEIDKPKSKVSNSHDTVDGNIKIKHRSHERKCWIQFRRQDIGNFIKQLVHAKPDMIPDGIPTSPAFITFMCLRYADYNNDDRSIQGLLTNYINGIRAVIKKSKSNINMTIFWLANTCRLTHLIKQYSGDELAEGGEENQRWNLQNFNLDDYCQVLTDLSVRIYHELLRTVHEKLQTIIIKAMLEAELIPDVSPSKQFFKSHPSKAQSGINVTTITKILVDLLTVLKEFDIDAEVIKQVFRQIFYFIAAYMLNNMLLRKDMCNWSKGMQIRYNISQLEEWCRDNDLSESGAIESLEYVTQATQLLQVSKKTKEDVDGIFDMCNRLNPLQIQKILTMYMPISEFEDRVPASIIQYVAARGGTQNSNYRLMMDLTYMFPVTFLFAQSLTKLEDVLIPEGLKLQQYLTIQ
ncbi:uncharacterized protein TRIADDRAFT_24346, partial [Trichoplax adhaerens]